MKRSWLVVVTCLWSASTALAQGTEQVEVRGNHRVDAETIRAVVATRPGQRPDPGRLRSDLRAIWKLGMFSDVQAVVDDRGLPPGGSGAEGRRGWIDDRGLPPGGSGAEGRRGWIDDRGLPPGGSGAEGRRGWIDDRGLPPGGSGAEGRRGWIDDRGLPPGGSGAEGRRGWIDDRGLPPGGSGAEGRRGWIDGDSVVFEVVERPAIRKILVAGNHELALDKIDEVLELKRDELVDEVAIRRSRDKIAELYVAHGFLFATVDGALVPAGGGEADVRFTVDEHAKVTVSDIAFTGNRAISGDELRKQMSTSPPGALAFITGSGVFRRDELERDLAILTGYYLDHGFAAVKIAPPALQLSRDGKRMTVRIAIEEGARFACGAIGFKGDLLGTPAQHLALIRGRPGARFSRSMIEADRKALEIHYQDLGFANASVVPRPRVDAAHHRIAIDFEIVRGKRVFIERVAIRGNSKTHDKVIRRELEVAEGELFSATNFERSRQRVTALGYFENVAISTHRGSSDDMIDVEVEVRERSTDTFQAGAGFSSTDSFIAQGQVAMQNLLGRGQALSGQVQLSGVRRLFALHFVDPYFLDSQWTLGAELYSQSLSFGAYARTSTGGSLTLGYPLADQLHGFLTYRLENVGIASGFGGFAGLGATGSPLPAQGPANLLRGGWTSSIRGSLAYDTRDDRLFPKAGAYATAYAEYAGRLTGSENALVRYGGFARRYQHLGPFTLRLNAELGVTRSLDGRGVPLTERYLLGGISDLRGYEPRSLGPHLWSQRAGDVGQRLDPLAIGGNLQVIGNAELEFPILKNLGISGVAFFDIGNAYNLESRFCSRPGSDACTGGFDAVGSLRKSVGLGVRWLSPMGPLRFEWGLPLDLRPGEKADGLEFSIGGSF